MRVPQHGWSAGSTPRRWVVRASLAVLLGQAVLVGVWAGVAPLSFFTDFPGLGLRWIAPGDIYDEHLVRDVGTLHLALGVGTAAALVGRTSPRLVGLMWLTMSLPHLVFHAGATEGLTAANLASSLGALALALVASLLLVLAAGPGVAPADAARGGGRR